MRTARVQKRGCRPTVRTDDVISHRVQTDVKNARRDDVILDETKLDSTVSLPADTYNFCYVFAVRTL